MTTKTRASVKEPSDIIERFKDFCRRRSPRAMSDITLLRYGKIIDHMSRAHSLPLDCVDLDELARVLTERAKRVSQGKLSPSTYNTEIAVIRRWCEFHDLDPTEKQVRKVVRFKRLREDDLKQSRRLTDADVLQPEDVEEVIAHFYALEWKALVATLWDTGCRIGEVCGLDYENVTRDAHGFVLHVKKSKTKSRSLRLITADIGLKYFQPYYLSHNGKGALFKMRRGGRIEPQAVRKELYQLGKKTGRKCWPTVFRKSASTFWKKSGILSDPGIRKRLGHGKNSRTFEQWYLQHGDESQKNEELGALGVFKEIEVRIEPKRCWRCGVAIPDTETHCVNCQAPSSGKTLLDDVQKTSELENLKSQFDNMETLLTVLVQAISKDPKLKKHINALASKGIEPFIDLLE